MPFGAIVSLKAQKVERIGMLLCWIKHLLFLTKDKSLFTHLPALTTGLNIPGSDSWTWMNQSGSHWTVSGVPHSNHSNPQLGLNRTIQHLKKRKQWGTGWDFVDKEIIRVAPGELSPFFTSSWGHLPGSEISLKMNMVADFCDISDPSWIME